MKKIFFIGLFPPPYGGATVKNHVNYLALMNYFEIDKFDTNQLNNSIVNKIKFFLFLIRNRKNKGIISVSSISLFKITNLMHRFSRKMLENMSLFIVGGNLRQLLIEKKQDISVYNKYKNIYVETNKMMKDLNSIGLLNVSVVPNCRFSPSERKLHATNDTKVLKCLFFSRITPDKGVEKIIEASTILNDCSIGYKIDFYGPIDREYKDKFISSVDKNSNLNYCGVVEADKIEIYTLIQNYDVLLFPTYHDGEGLPGIVVECKIAGIPIIASDWNYNSEIIQHNYDGIILKHNTSKELARVIVDVSNNREFLSILRENSYKTGERYFIENYIKKICDNM